MDKMAVLALYGNMAFSHFYSYTNFSLTCSHCFNGLDVDINCVNIGATDECHVYVEGTRMFTVQGLTWRT